MDELGMTFMSFHLMYFLDVDLTPTYKYGLTSQLQATSNNKKHYNFNVEYCGFFNLLNLL